MPPETERIRDVFRGMLPELAAKYGVAELGIFGSRVRGDNRPDSDLDVLVTFHPDAKPSLFTLGSIVSDLEDATGVTVDLSMKNNLKAILRPYILQEAIPV